MAEPRQHGVVSRRGNNEDSPEQKGRDYLRTKRTVANREQRDQARFTQYGKLMDLAQGVPKSVLPPGGITQQMSRQDAEAAARRIGQYEADKARAQNPTQARQPYQPSAAPPQSPGIFGFNTNPSQSQPPAGTVRPAQGGGSETMMQAESGPRFVSSVSNPPPLRAPDRSAGGDVVQRQFQMPAPGTSPMGNRATDAAALAANRTAYQPGGLFQNNRQPYQPNAEAPSDAQARMIAQRYGGDATTRATGGTIAQPINPAQAPVAYGPPAPTQTPQIAGPPTPTTNPSPNGIAANAMQSAARGVAARPKPPVQPLDAYGAGAAIRSAPGVASARAKGAYEGAGTGAAKGIASIVQPIRDAASQFGAGLTGTPQKKRQPFSY